jgi:hypothetical protein
MLLYSRRAPTTTPIIISRIKCQRVCKDTCLTSSHTHLHTYAPCYTHSSCAYCCRPCRTVPLALPFHKISANGGGQEHSVRSPFLRNLSATSTAALRLLYCTSYLINSGTAARSLASRSCQSKPVHCEALLSVWRMMRPSSRGRKMGVEHQRRRRWVCSCNAENGIGRGIQDEEGRGGRQQGVAPDSHSASPDTSHPAHRAAGRV